VLTRLGRALFTPATFFKPRRETTARRQNHPPASIEAPPTASATDDADHDGIANEIPTSVVDHMEFYLLNYFKPGHGSIRLPALFNDPDDIE
jgi:hypothetical protein